MTDDKWLEKILDRIEADLKETKSDVKALMHQEAKRTGAMIAINACIAIVFTFVTNILATWLGSKH